ncbi:MAG: C10 family peptidase, partial [Chloroflexi bacterium]|nr:C10 family peptidase [Chloroflexota bacterium]
PMGSRLGKQVKSIETFTDEQGQPVYYVVYLRPNGFVIVPDEDLIEPVVCFSSGGSYDPSDRNPLGALVSRDLPGRVNAVRVVQKKTAAGQAEGGLAGQKAAVRDSTEKALGKWRKLLADDSNSPGLKTVSVSVSSVSVSDVRVAPLLQTKWGQDVVCGNACFNYYTPPDGEGDASNYSSGCVATAMAQYMRFWEYPTAGVGTGHFTISVDGSSQTGYLRGGDGLGGAYNWSEMVLVPGCSTTLTQRQAIGALAYDAGVASKMDYAADGSASYTSDAAAALVGTFGYSNAIYGYNSNDNIGAGLNGMLNPNLDWGNPVILGVSSADAGHEIVTDGYGYNGLTLYHHLNMGWDGDQDVWYNLPNIDDSYSPFDVVDGAIYNIYISGTGEIISGRVTVAGSGVPISGATVTALMTGGTYQATTNAKGIYAIANVPSNSTYTVSVTKSGYSFTSQAASTGLSRDSHAVSGNCWAIDFTGMLTEPMPVDSVPIVAVKKLSVAVGSNYNSGAISFSGTMNAITGLMSATSAIEVTVDSNDMISPCVLTFPINDKTFKKDNYSYSGTKNGVKKSFTYNLKTGKFTFAARNVNLSGLDCPMAVAIKVGDYIGTADVTEAIVKKPIPINLMMAVKDVLRVDKIKVNKLKSNQLSVTGGFAVADPAVSMADRVSEDLVVTLGAQQFTIPASELSAGQNKFTCRNALVAEDGLATANFNFKTCVFTLTIKNTQIMADPDTADFSVEFFGFGE